MSLTNIAIISLVTAICFYIAFLVLGVGGIAQNRRAQGLDERSRNR